MKNLTELFKRLGLDSDKGLYLRSENIWQNECGFSNRISRLLEDKIQPDAFFCFDSKPLILFYDNPTNKKKIFKAVWNFNESPIVFILENGSVDIYNGFKFLKDKEELKFIGKEEKLNDFTYFELVTGKAWEGYESELSHKHRVDYFLLKNIKSARSEIVKKVFPDWSPKLERENTDDEQRIIQLANNLIGKVIFVSYLIDRNVEISFEGKKKKWKRTGFCSLLEDVDITKRFFNFLKQENQFNGDDLFPITDDEFDIVKKYNINKILINLLNGVEILSGQQSLFNIYDFSIIPVEFISNVYESFIGENNQAKEGAYYTPLFLVEYIISQTLNKYFEKNDKKYECKVLDPACGSGIFLVESLRVMINRYKALHKSWENDIPKFQTEIKKIATKNIFGIDKDSNAINVAIFSIYLTLLDYQNPKDIEEFQFPNIRNSNFVNRDFFSDTEDVNNLKRKEFSFILGNPPWKGGGMDEQGEAYLKKRRKIEKSLNKKYEIAVNNGEIAEGFMLRVSDFSNEQTQIALIVRSSILYNLGYKTDYSRFRRYWLEEFKINQVFELAPVRKEVFNKSNDPAIAPAVILFYKYAHGKNTDNSLIEHITLKPSRFFSLFNVFSLNRTDYKNVEQKKLKQFDWLWKTLVYGSYLDFNFIRHLKDDYSSVKEVISDKDKFVVGTGIQYSSQPEESSEHLIGLPLISTYAIDSFHVNYKKSSLFNKELVHRKRDSRLFKAPMFIVREGLNIKELKARGAIAYEDIVFKDSLTSIKAVSDSNLRTLKLLTALFCSELFAYLAINTFASIGIERERVKNYNKFSIPFIECDIEEIVSEIESLKNQIHLEKNKDLNDIITISKLESTVAEKLAEIDTKIFTELSIDNQEQAIIDYALNVNRPIIIKDKTAIKQLFNYITFHNIYLEDYANLFIDRFKSNLDDDEKKFIVEIWHSNQIIGMFFKMIAVSEYENDIVWIDKSNDAIMKIIAGLSSEKITESLFVQKDVRGFEEEYFYLFKPNEKRLWHKAIGYLDVDDFMDALLLAGKGGKHE